MRAVMNRELMYEELSYYLNQDEISLLQQAHKEQTDEEAFYDRGRPSADLVVRSNNLVLLLFSKLLTIMVLLCSS